jgi:hypothetical protein
MSLTRRARKFYPDNRRLAAKWLLSVRYLRARNLWVVDPGTPTPNWRAS